MSHPSYEHIGQPEDRVIEECSELIKAICKARRFGFLNWNPTTGKVNVDSILEEMKDVEDAVQKYRANLIEQGIVKL